MESFGIEVFDIIKDGCCTAERPGKKKKKKLQPETFLLLLRKCLLIALGNFTSRTCSVQAERTPWPNFGCHMFSGEQNALNCSRRRKGFWRGWWQHDSHEGFTNFWALSRERWLSRIKSNNCLANYYSASFDLKMYPDLKVTTEICAKESSDFATFEGELLYLHFLPLSHTATAYAFRGPQRERERGSNLCLLSISCKLWHRFHLLKRALRAGLDETF